MAGCRSWLGSLLSLLLFFCLRRLTVGLAAPSFLVVVFACSYIWAFVLRVPELRKATPGDQGDGESQDPGVRVHEAGAIAPTHSSEEAQSLDATGPDEAEEELQSSENDVVETAARPQTESAGPQVLAADVHGEPRAAAIPASAVTPRGPSAESPAAAEATAGAVRAPASASAQDAEEAAALLQGHSATAQAAQAGLPSGSSGEESLRRDADSAGDEEHIIVSSSETRVTAEAEAAEAGETREPAKNLPVPVADRDWGDSDSEDGDEQQQEENEFADPKRAQELRLEGNDFFKAGKLHNAREAYSEAIYLTPMADKKEKAVLYGNRAACLQKLCRWDDVVSDCKLAIDLDPEYTKAYVRRSAAYENLCRWHDALEDMKKAIELDPPLKSREYKHLAVLEKRSQEQFEKDKDEMLGKLKELGNTVLGKFGMSVDNFKMEQDPNTGSYSVKYQT